MENPMLTEVLEVYKSTINNNLDVVDKLVKEAQEMTEIAKKLNEPFKSRLFNSLTDMYEIISNLSEESGKATEKVYHLTNPK